MTRAKYYVVWKGRKRGIFRSWPECEKQVKGFVGAEYKAFESAAEARAALMAGYEQYRGKPSSQGKWRHSTSKPRLPSLCADAACSGSPGRLEYRVVETASGKQLLSAGPFEQGTNNVGEFLGIVEALRWIERQHQDWPVYSDSDSAITWVKNAKCRTKLARTSANRILFEMIERAEKELPRLLGMDRSSPGAAHVLKWDTRSWGEIPADFGRK
jgi:ribonuclease HI